MTGFDRENQENTTLSAKQEAFITALLIAPSTIAAAQIAGISEKTARRWLQLPHVQAAHQEAKREVFTSGLDELKSSVSLAVRTLKKHLTDEETPPTVQVRAAEIIIKQAVEIQHMQELEEKIAALEDLINRK